MIKYIGVLILACLAYLPAAATAAERGAISKIDFTQREFTLTGKRYTVPAQIRVGVLGLDTHSSDFSSLTEGFYVQLRYVRGKKNSRRVIELKLIPQ
ncbi:MAG: hypothetical protein MJK13_12995 [Pseudomonadales bacterium]|nr:hypothetical protein [Pseudomonadales bacterium]